MAVLWMKMGDLFNNLWISREGEICDKEGIYLHGFLLWCRKCNGLSPREYKKRFEQLEEKCRLAEQAGKKCYPPNYAEFIGMCTQSPETACHKPFKRLGIEDKTAIENGRKAGKPALEKMKEMFD